MATVHTPMVPWPHIGRYPISSTNRTPRSTPGTVGGRSTAATITVCPRGSKTSILRRWSNLSLTYRCFSNMVSPGTGAKPPVMTRVGMPSVWESTAVTIFSRSIFFGLPIEVIQQHRLDGKDVLVQGFDRPLLVPLLATFEDLPMFLLPFPPVVHRGEVDAQVPVELVVQVPDYPE